MKTAGKADKYVFSDVTQLDNNKAGKAERLACIRVLSQTIAGGTPTFTRYKITRKYQQCQSA